MLTARGLYAVNSALSEPPVDAARRNLNQSARLPRGQQLAVAAANRAQRRHRTDDRAFALEGYDLDSSFYHRRGGAIIRSLKTDVVTPRILLDVSQSNLENNRKRTGKHRAVSFMAVQVSKRYLLGDYNLEPDKRSLCVGEDSVHLANGPFQVLLYLVENRDRVVTRNELLDRFWDGKDVYDDSVRKCIGAIRKALHDRSENPRFIETHYAEGYRYIGPLEEQLVQGAPCIVEIEKTRGVKIVIEEEEIQEAISKSEQAVNLKSSATALSLTKPTRKRQAIAMASILLLIALTIAALFVFRGRTDSNASSVSDIRSIAVLPLKNLTGDPSQEYFNDGMTESLITELSKISGLKVISRASAFTFKDKEIDARDVGKRLGVASMLEGSVRRNGDRVRVEVRLVSTEDGRVIWAGNNYDRALKDLFAVQDEIGCSVAANLKVMLCGEATPKRYTDNVEAYQAYLKGRYFWNKRTGEGIKRAIEHFDQAIAIDPKYALAYAGLADCYNLGVWYVPLEPKQATVNAKAAAAKALELDDALSEAHNAMAAVCALEWDWLNSKKESEKAIELNHGSAGAHHRYALFLNYTKRPDEAIREIKLAQELDPLSLVMNTDEGLGYYYAGRYDEAIAAYRRALDLDPNYVAAREYIGRVYAAKGMFTEALEEFQKAVTLSDRPDLLAYLGYIYAATGKKVEAQKTLGELNRLSKQKYVPPYDIAVMYAALGQKDQAFAWLERMVAEHSIYITQLPLEPVLNPLRSDPRFNDLLRRVGLSG